MNRVTCSKPRVADRPPPEMPERMNQTLPEFKSTGQLGAIKEALDHVEFARSYTDTQVNVDPYLKLAATALRVATERIEARS